jgi:tetratricopeptide (TPR) repeat protein
MAQKKCREAAALYQTLLRKGEKSPETYQMLATSLWRGGRPFQAEKIFEEGVSAYPGFVPLWIESAKLYRELKQPAKAESALQVAIQLKPDQAIRAHNLLARVYMDAGNYPEAEAVLKKAVAAQPLELESHATLADLYLSQGRKQEAITKLQADLRDDPKNPGAYLTLAMLHESSKDYAAAMQVYASALEADTDFWFAANNLAFLIAETTQMKADLERAKALALKAVQTRPQNPALLDTLGWVLFRMGDLQMAQRLIEQALFAAPEDEVLNYHLGAVLKQLSRNGDAREKLEKALTGERDFCGREEAKQMLAELKG